MPSKRKTSHNVTQFFIKIITKVICLFLCLAPIFALCHFILPNKPTQTDSLLAPTQKLENIPTLPPTSPTQKLKPTLTPTIVKTEPTITIATPTINPPTITPIISITPSVYCSFPIEQVFPTFTGTSYIIADLNTEEILLSYQPELQLYPASTIKLLTAMVGLDLSDAQKQLTMSKTSKKHKAK